MVTLRIEHIKCKVGTAIKSRQDMDTGATDFLFPVAVGHNAVVGQLSEEENNVIPKYIQNISRFGEKGAVKAGF